FACKPPASHLPRVGLRVIRGTVVVDPAQPRLQVVAVSIERGEERGAVAGLIGPQHNALTAHLLRQVDQFMARSRGNLDTPCFGLAVMNPSRSPSNTAWVLPTSMLVRRSLMRDWSSTYERIW